MKYLSTRGEAVVNESYTAITMGLAHDGGLFVPELIPSIDIKELFNKEMSYNDMAYEILSKYLYDYGEDSLRESIQSAYGKSFDTNVITPITKVNDDIYSLELWHGPTAAFKDMALQLLPHLLVKGKKMLSIDDDTIILVATSGDTGKAALEGFKDVDKTKVITFYPKDGVADLQEIQMNSQEGDNVYVVAVEGNFDDTQTGVKKLFSDAKIKDILKSKNMAFSSANSINFGRLCPQIVYYFYSYYLMVCANEIELGDKIDFVVPTGNFGNILAAWYAKHMGLPVGRLVCASNENNILTDFFNTGRYDVHRQFHKTMSPSMDILISSNLERLLFEVSNRNGETIKSCMKSLKDNGYYEVENSLHEQLKTEFIAECACEDECKKVINEVYSKYNYLMDTHTAVAYAVANKIEKSDNKMIVLSTASPYKFPDSVLLALGVDVCTDSFDNIDKLSSITNIVPPKCIYDLKNLKIRHNMSCKIEDMGNTLIDIIK